MTLGVRAVALNAAGEVLLVEHTYSRGWHLPGGGVERGETAEEGMARELAEEAGLILTGEPRLNGIYTGLSNFPGDPVLGFRVDQWRQGEATSRGEILRTLWAPHDALPETREPASTPTPRRRRHGPGRLSALPARAGPANMPAEFPAGRPTRRKR